jgi:ketosteroid isomerase-like protein
VGANEEFARRALGAEGERRNWDLGRMRSASELHWHPEIVYVEGDDWPGAGTFQGRDAILARFEEYSEVIGDLEAEAESIDELDDGRVLAVIRAYGRSVAGVPVERRWAYVFTISDEKLIHWQAELDPERTRTELGLET